MPASADSSNKSYLMSKVIYSPDLGCYGGSSWSYKDKESRYEYKVWNDAQERPKPDDLISHQTALPLQYTLTRNHAYLSPIQTRAWNFNCQGQPAVQKVYTGYHQQVGILDASWPEVDWSLAMRLRIKAMSTNLGQSLVEYRQTSRMFGGFAKAAHDGWKLMHGRLPRKRRPITPCTLASAQLMNSYGIQPLASDLFESYQILLDRLKLPIRKRVIVTRKNTRTDEETVGYMVTKESTTTSKRAICYVDLDPETSPFTYGNPAELAWEVIPFSFVVDWAIPIGDTLSALDALRGVTGIQGTESAKYTRVTKGWIRRPNYQGVYLTSSTPGSVYYKGHQRSVITSIPLPPVPRWDPSSSWKTVANGLALLTAVNKRCRK